MKKVTLDDLNKQVGLLNQSIRELPDISQEKLKPTGITGLIKSAVDFIPGGRLGEGVGYALSSKYINKLEQDSIKSGAQLQTKLIEQIQAGKSTERLNQIAKDTLKTPLISETALKDAPTTKQILASSADLIATAALGYKPNLTSAGKIGVIPMSRQSVKAINSLGKELKAIEQAYLLKDARPLLKFGVEKVLPTAKSALTGAGFMALAELYMNRRATVQDVLDSSLLGAGIGVAIPVGASVFGKTIRLASKGTKFAWEASTGGAVKKLREIASGNLQALDYSKNPKDILKTINNYNLSLKEKFAKSAIGVVDKTGNFERLWIDSNAPFKEVQERIFKIRGKNMTDEEKLYYRIGMVDSISNHKGHMAIADFDKALKPYKQIEPELKTYLLYTDYIDRGILGQKTPGGKTLEENLAGLKVFLEGLTPEQKIHLNNASNIVKNTINTFLDKRVAEGLISPELTTALKSLHPNYIPHKVILEELGDQIHKYAKNSMNVSDSTIKKAIGSIRKIEDPIAATREMMMLVESTVSRNKFLKSMVEAQEKYNVIPGMRRVETADNILARLKAAREINILKGVETSKVDKIISEAREYKNLDKFIKAQGDIDNNLQLIYNKVYGEETNKLNKLGGVFKGEGLGGLDKGGKIGNIGADSKPNVSGIVKHINNNPQGFTLNLNGKPVTDGFIVSPYKGLETVVDKVDAKTIDEFITKNIDLLRKEGNFLGGWRNDKNGKFYLDISVATNDIDSAIKVAANNSQIGIYDIKGDKTIYTGEFLKEKLKEVYNKAHDLKSLTGKDVNKLLTKTQKEYSEIANKIQESIKKADSLLEEAAIKNLDTAVTNTQITGVLNKFETAVKKYNTILNKGEQTGSFLTSLKNIDQSLKEQIAELVGVISDNKKLAKNLGEETINFFRKGQMETWVVPNDIASSIKGLDGETMPRFWKYITKPQQVFKSFVTTSNLTFAARNKARDTQVAEVIGTSLIDEFQKKFGLSPKSVNMSSKELMQMYREMGGYGADIFTEARGRNLTTFNKVGIERFKENFNPLELIAEINERVEMSTRLNMFRRALEGGLSPLDSAYVARNASIDFSKMGTAMRPINQIVPFLNARVQDLVNISHAAKNAPEAMFRGIAQTTVYPALVLQKHNMQFDSYKDISQDVKNRNWIIMYNEVGAFIDGEWKMVPQMLMVPKGEPQQLMVSPLQYLMDRQAKIDKRSLSEMLFDTVGEMSPVASISPFGKSFYSQLGIAAVPIGITTNKHLFYGTDILTPQELKLSRDEQFKSWTPNYVKDMTKMVNKIIFGKDADIKGIAPAYTDFFIQGLGGLPQDISFIVSSIYDKANAFDVAMDPLTNSGFGSLSQYPILRGLMREDRMTQSSANIKEREVKTRAEAQEADINAYKSRTIDYHLNKIQKMTNGEEVGAYLNMLVNDGLLSEDDISQIHKKIINQRFVGTLKKSDSNQVKASVIAYQMEQMESKEEVGEYLIHLVKSEIINEETMVELFKTTMGSSAVAIYNDLNKMNTAEERSYYLNNLVEKGLLDEKTLENVMIIKKYEKFLGR